MIIYVVTEYDERDTALQSGPLSAHVDKARADVAARKFNAPKRGRLSEVGHYAQVLEIELDGELPR